ncbi:DUF4238 domain-containing protein [Actinomycetospora callitridis]|uniref:DUF4238 domain-containing protein n=1 Tax=Actinomycetospora callitridis TaxID=913944 RepID=UPI002365F43A|nr:DUF4238 domain-containing protein [Actinomycetospora callitridis]MDD7920979.1 DUF4238 domain-containing protein [Actinomycetospora callitridis]
MMERAKRNELGSPARKHHLVPASYLRGWSDRGQIRVTVVDEVRTWITSPEKAARETDFYSLKSDDLDPEKVPPLLFETMLSEVEGWGRSAIDELLIKQPSQVDPKLMAKFTWFLGFQLSRGNAFREENKLLESEIFRLKHEGMTDEGIRGRLEEQGYPNDPKSVARARKGLDAILRGDVILAPQRAALVGRAAEVADELGGHLLQREWFVHETPGVLVTCDEPLIRIGGPGNLREERAGIASAGVIIFPLSPRKLLSMALPGIRTDLTPRLDEAETAELNREIIAASSRWAFERPSKHVTERMRVPLAPPPFVTEGPIPHLSEPNREVYRNYSPTRWTEAPLPPWPVQRWWR